MSTVVIDPINRETKAWEVLAGANLMPNITRCCINFPARYYSPQLQHLRALNLTLCLLQKFHVAPMASNLTSNFLHALKTVHLALLSSKLIVLPLNPRSPTPPPPGLPSCPLSPSFPLPPSSRLCPSLPFLLSPSPSLSSSSLLFSPSFSLPLSSRESLRLRRERADTTARTTARPSSPKSPHLH